MKYLLPFLGALLLGSIAYADTGFALSGRISIRHQDAAYHGVIDWLHSDQTDELVLTSPLGQGVAELRRNGASAVLSLPNGERHEAATLEALAARLFGTPLPLAALPDWMRGIAPQAERNEARQPRRLVLPDWTVECLRYDEAGRPQLLSLESPDLALRLRIDRWDEAPLRSQP